MNSFLPNDYKRPEPAGGSYTKLADGANRLRIMSAPVFGHEYWTKDKKPVRSRTPFEAVPEDAKLDDGKFKPKFFWALVVWNYATGNLQVWEITQASIQGPIEDLAVNKDWGDPREYDLTINKKGEGLETEYTVQPAPHKEIPVEAHKAYRDQRVNLEALFEGGDPFTVAAGSQGADMSNDEKIAGSNPGF
jgi:hypothetical protein